MKCANCNRRLIQNSTSVYQMKLCTVSIALIISTRPFVFIKGKYIGIQLIIYYAINVKYILVTKIPINQMGRNLFGLLSIGVFYTEKNMHNNYSSGLMGIFFL